MKCASVAILVLCCLSSFGQHIVLRDSVQKSKLVPDIVLKPAYTISIATIPQDQFTKCFGFFCRQELKMQKAHIPVTFRLGSMEMTNRLEGKTH